MIVVLIDSSEVIHIYSPTQNGHSRHPLRKEGDLKTRGSRTKGSSAHIVSTYCRIANQPTSFKRQYNAASFVYISNMGRQIGRPPWIHSLHPLILVDRFDIYLLLPNKIHYFC